MRISDGFVKVEDRCWPMLLAALTGAKVTKVSFVALLKVACRVWRAPLVGDRSGAKLFWDYSRLPAENFCKVKLISKFHALLVTCSKPTHQVAQILHTILIEVSRDVGRAPPPEWLCVSSF